MKIIASGVIALSLIATAASIESAVDAKTFYRQWASDADVKGGHTSHGRGEEAQSGGTVLPVMMSDI